MKAQAQNFSEPPLWDGQDVKLGKLKSDQNVFGYG